MEQGGSAVHQRALPPDATTRGQRPPQISRDGPFLIAKRPQFPGGQVSLSNRSGGGWLFRLSSWLERTELSLGSETRCRDTSRKFEPRGKGHAGTPGPANRATALSLSTPVAATGHQPRFPGRSGSHWSVSTWTVQQTRARSRPFCCCHSNREGPGGA